MKDDTRISWKFLRDQLHARILDGSYKAGEKLPRDQDLATQFGCARATVQRAMRDLADKGLIERRRKGGTTVCTHPVTRATLDIPVIRIEVENAGAQYGYRLIRAGRAPAPANVLARFRLPQPETMLHVEALHLKNGAPYIHEDRWVSLRTVPEILSVDLRRESANEWLVRNRPCSHGDLRFHALRAGDVYARLLAAEANDALLAIERTTWIEAAPITSVQAVAAPGYELKSTI